MPHEEITSDARPFPSDTFLKTFFGPDQEFVHAGLNTTAYHEFRRELKLRFQLGPIQLLGSELRAGNHNARFYLFKKRCFSPEMETILSSEELIKLFNNQAVAILYTECVEQIAAGNWFSKPWCRWRTEDESVWVERVPDAFANGKNPLRRSWSDVMNQSA